MGNHNKIHFAHGVNDQMSFNEAFSAARQEVGPGGAFVWHGTVYGTYYGSEWNVLSPSEQHAFTSDAVYTYHHQDEDAPINKPSKIQGPTQEETHEPKVNVIMVDPDYELDPETHVGLGVVEIDGIEVLFIDVDQDGIFDLSIVDENQNGKIDDNEVQIEESGLSVSDLQAFQQETQSGKITTTEHHVPEGVEVEAVFTNVEITEEGDLGNVGIAKINGVDSVLIDVDQNGTFDVAMGDFNGDGEISNNEILEVDNPQLTVQNFEQELQAQNGMDSNGNLVAYNNTPDYSNHEDISDFGNQMA